MPDSRRQEARLHPSDAARLGVQSGDEVSVTSRSGRISVRVKVSDEIAEGCIAVPHGWGHAAGWRRANAAGGANSNLLASRRPGDLEPLAAMSVLNGIPVRVEASRPIREPR
jgi:formate dehydrogenase